MIERRHIGPFENVSAGFDSNYLRKGKQMLKRLMCTAMILSMMTSSFALAAPVKKGSANNKRKPAKIGKKAVPVKKSTAKIAPANVSDTGSEEAQDSVADVREDMNKALADLKGQLDTVKKDNSDVKVSGELRIAYTKNVENTTTKNNFDVTRAYLTFKKKLGWDAAVRVTLDVARLAATSAFTGTSTPKPTGTVSTTMSTSVLSDYIKYAYVDLPVNIPASLQVIPVTLTGKIGLQHNMWIDWADKIWENAYIMKQFDDNEGIMSSADFGLGATGKFTVPYLPEIEYHATVFNGTGYKSAETNSDKDIAVRLNSNVYADDNIGTVILGGYLNSKNGLDNTQTLNTKQAGVLAALKNDTYGTAYVEYVKGTKINGYSLGGFVYPAPSILPGVGLVARVDNYDPDTTASNNEIKRSLIGSFYKFGEDVRLALDLQTSQTGNAAIQKTAYLHTVVTF